MLNVGAGTGSYEPADRWVLAVEPSATMRAQRPAARRARDRRARGGAAVRRRRGRRGDGLRDDPPLGAAGRPGSPNCGGSRAGRSWCSRSTSTTAAVAAGAPARGPRDRAAALPGDRGCRARRSEAARGSSGSRRPGTASTASSRRSGGGPRRCSTPPCAARSRCGRSSAPRRGADRQRTGGGARSGEWDAGTGTCARGELRRLAAPGDLRAAAERRLSRRASPRARCRRSSSGRCPSRCRLPESPMYV